MLSHVKACQVKSKANFKASQVEVRLVKSKHVKSSSAEARQVKSKASLGMSSLVFLTL